MENPVKFGFWTVLRATGRKWLCRCDCGVEREVPPHDLRHGKSRGCGHDRYEAAAKAAKAANTTHGLTDGPEMRSWADMKRRCHSPHRKDYHRYGGRGIYVCDEWRESFSNFYRDMGPRPEGHTLERRDNDGPYSKENCIWADKATQSANTRQAVYYDFCGERLTIPQASAKYGLKQETIRSRIEQRGWSPSEAVTKPAQPAVGRHAAP